ncbi:MAG: RNA-binding S4 domain-containing protein [Acholeplasmatales bacterium]|jgi:ribosomal 50S subunit-recycling heat shock protein|nr:RNA-binding S4 domain-containing protein [Acholeplasmatales bacterium]
MRIDKFLKVSRIIKRRTLAKEAAVRKLLTIGDKELKPSYQVKVNDIITLTLGFKIIVFKVLSLSKLEEMYLIVSETFRKGEN